MGPVVPNRSTCPECQEFAITQLFHQECVVEEHLDEETGDVVEWDATEYGNLIPGRPIVLICANGHRWEGGTA